jgi:excisionase family DNA binding protein
MPILMTRAEVAAALKISDRSLARCVASGRLQPVRLGRNTRFRVCDVEALIRQCAVGASV